MKDNTETQNSIRLKIVLVCLENIIIFIFFILLVDFAIAIVSQHIPKKNKKLDYLLE